ncbi:DNA-binding response OmpR family regulator [Clostridium acetobutylicum]|uniref:Stage 0 sporulation protein A homolog n=1 Tax=Clostridium acetobutylicum (strain ATCC 824 / DSM 792 / JCM 1419 / IAM 19013 / LMG 5710 / NBRC 13948 / NRRL B-527 / VKM B-1787 / 2291 / W) TaxID=272562 RepID=Q97IT8_CLOAB|nr:MULTISPECIES: response regulator transcription factor [Clostridium]AAK79519.1 Response regulator (CheY-like receiver domain and HTH DNA-binding domain) [Clostridium acetobutylicum ATCC 824]ADZ20604.1 Response regulator (CheY-like receiver domain and HTH DNA-binding domain) [Clostridium acetobutylicum EA 2018]AEI31864.1 response regulator [Clostridium acetobutylicum DSM 1731]AWV81236.1 DNA-binding response regulator [Clostridium acetobutylicum]MBC2392869.1 response regulator transcription fa
MKNILVVEDEENVLEIVRAYLEKEGYNVYCTTQGLDGIELFKKVKFQLVILDLMLPDIDGEEVCRILRRISDVYIFILTAKVALKDRIEGLNMGADEYLLKPCSPRELTARVNALFRRVFKDENNTDFDDGNLQICSDKRIVRIKDQQISLTPNEFDILYALVLNKGRVLSREQLIERVFGLDFDGFDRTIDVHIKNIRKKIEEDTKKPKYIITVTKLGYKFGGDIK